MSVCQAAAAGGNCSSSRAWVGVRARRLEATRCGPNTQRRHRLISAEMTRRTVPGHRPASQAAWCRGSVDEADRATRAKSGRCSSATALRWHCTRLAAQTSPRHPLSGPTWPPRAWATDGGYEGRAFSDLDLLLIGKISNSGVHTHQVPYRRESRKPQGTSAPPAPPQGQKYSNPWIQNRNLNSISKEKKMLPALSLWAVSSFCASRPSARSVLSRSGA